MWVLSSNRIPFSGPPYSSTLPVLAGKSLTMSHPHYFDLEYTTPRHLDDLLRLPVAVGAEGDDRLSVLQHLVQPHNVGVFLVLVHVRVIDLVLLHPVTEGTPGLHQPIRLRAPFPSPNQQDLFSEAAR